MLYDESKLKKEIQDTIDNFKDELKTITTGKPTPEVFESIQVEAYGTSSPLNALGQVIVEDAVSVKINVWDKGVLKDVEAALRNADLGASVLLENDGVRLRFNPITEEDRKEKVKDLGDTLEDAKIKIRQIRQDFRKDLDSLEGVSEDDVKRDEESIQKAVNDATDELDKLAEKKEEDLMSV